MALSVRTTRVPVFMLKWLILMAFVALLWYGRRHRRPRAPRIDRLVRCARCNRHLPLQEAVRRADGDFCCPQHAGDDQ
ncbi:hypothetical protein AFE_2897 [Acidithiobacillus ferrooxidans ATCC 23270]|uniref:Uncharacterized protein n=1 Tax=Acidithiobacillus ferrooxidans (strain ATCC 23270 / DSM 14882 / CIP 104768 / NCIMB 8455) TaxID=243159 RepID=B7J989_ACIF2|nr:hypothetical protein AFE_2897 [Acidithiobacillus ferrooxidans ATCC 23270]